MAREIASEPLEGGLCLRITPLSRRSIGVDQESPRAPRRAARRHPLEQEVRHARELPDVARSVVGVLEEAKRRVDETRQLGRGEGKGGGGIGPGGVAVEHDLKIGRFGQGAVLREETYAREIRGGWRLWLQRIARNDGLVGPGRIRATTQRVEAAR